METRSATRVAFSPNKGRLHRRSSGLIFPASIYNGESSCDSAQCACQSTESDQAKRFNMRGTCYNVIQRVATKDERQTIVWPAVWFPAENAVESLGPSRRDPRFQVLLSYMNHAFESYAVFAEQYFQVDQME